VSRPPRPSCFPTAPISAHQKGMSAMSLIYNSRTQSASLPCQRKLVGTRHEGPLWTNTVRELRKATKKAARLASWRPGVTPDGTALKVIDFAEEMDPGKLHTLELVASILVRPSRR
jgi:hypothetical protein